MRTPWWLTLTAMALACPSVANAQFFPGPPVFVPPPPHVWIHQRVRWHHYRHLVPGGVWVSPAPPPVWIAPQPPAPPPPPVYVAPPPPVYIEPQAPIYVQPQPIYVQPPVMNPYPPVVLSAPPTLVVAAPPKPGWVNKFGFGATVEGLYATALITDGDTSMSGWGILGQLRYRAGRHIALELAGGYEGNKQSNGQASFDRRDVPIAFGLLVPILGPEYRLSPYLVGAVGLNFADLKLIDASTLQLDDSRTQALAQLGAGLELRLGNHFAINLDLRGEWRWNLGGPSDAVKNTTSIDGKAVVPIADSVGIRVGLGGTVYF
jgi:hypothetical protein